MCSWNAGAVPDTLTNMIGDSPSRMARSASPIADMPDRHTLLIVTEGTVIGSPPDTAA